MRVCRNKVGDASSDEELGNAEATSGGGGTDGIIGAERGGD